MPSSPGSVAARVSVADSVPVDFAARLAEHTRARSEHTALALGDETLSWGEFGRRVAQTANALRALGLERTEKVAILAANSFEYVILFAGTVVAGGCAVPLSGMVRGDAIERMIRDCDARVLAVSESMREHAEPFAGQLEQILPGGLIGLDFADGGWRDFHAWIREHGAGWPEVRVRPSDPFDLIYSSGTTGTPKGIEHPHAMRARHLLRGQEQGMTENAITLASTPLYSNTTLVALLPTLAGGGSVVLMKKFDAGEFLQLAERHRVTHAMLVPVQYQRILAHPDFDRYDLSSFRLKLSTSAPLRRSVIEEANRRWPGDLIEVYGLTEGGVSTFLDTRRFPDKLDTAGRPPETVDLVIIDEQGRPLPRGEVGEVVGRSEAMMTGYYKRPDKTGELFWYDRDGRLYFRTGDMGRLDEDGFLQLLDRKKDMIISGGFNVYATDLEQVLLAHPDVTDAAVVGVPSEQWGETPVAVVVLRPGADDTPEALREWANARLGKTQRLAAVQLRESLPRSTIGKVLKRTLRQEFLAAGE
ncbi:MAG TPA: class I adenylate-forming enzyme family protein [Gammaproteobacteria bacterium]|nr:class I adenylate-forming enzyme family protein [Gammaproteobacteria bacterium]